MGSFTGIREFFSDSLTDTKRARPITDHVNQLMSGRLRLMKSSTALNKLVCQCKELNILYLYDWMWQGAEKVQAAWGVWKFHPEDEIIHFEFDQAILMLLVNSKGVLRILMMDMGYPPEGYGIDFPVRLDSRMAVQATKVSDGVGEESDKWSLPNHLLGYSEEEIFVLAAEGFYTDYAGMDIEFTATSDIKFDNQNLIPDGVDKAWVVVGLKFDQRYVPSAPYPRSPDGTARTDIDRLQVGQMLINYERSGPAKATVKLSTGREFDYSLTPRIIGGIENIVGLPPPVLGFYNVPIRSRANLYELVLESDSYRPIEIRELEYKGTYRPRGRNM